MLKLLLIKDILGKNVLSLPKQPLVGELAIEEKDFNRSICISRAAIKNINQRLKNYVTLGNVHRGSYDNIDKISKIAHAVSTLCNLQLCKYHVRKYRS